MTSENNLNLTISYLFFFFFYQIGKRLGALKLHVNISYLTTFVGTSDATTPKIKHLSSERYLNMLQTWFIDSVS